MAKGWNTKCAEWPENCSVAQKWVWNSNVSVIKSFFSLLSWQRGDITEQLWWWDTTLWSRNKNLSARVPLRLHWLLEHVWNKLWQGQRRTGKLWNAPKPVWDLEEGLMIRSLQCPNTRKTFSFYSMLAWVSILTWIIVRSETSLFLWRYNQTVNSFKASQTAELKDWIHLSRNEPFPIRASNQSPAHSCPWAEVSGLLNACWLIFMGMFVWLHYCNSQKLLDMSWDHLVLICHLVRKHPADSWWLAVTKPIYLLVDPSGVQTTELPGVTTK